MTQHTQTEVPHLNCAARSPWQPDGGGVSYLTFINTHIDVYLYTFLKIHKDKQTFILACLLKHLYKC